MTDEQKMRIALDIAKDAMDKNEMPIAAVIFHNDEIISSAYTAEKTEKRFLVHAELLALIEADKKHSSIRMRKEMQLFTTLEPCLMCMGAAMSFFIGEIVYALEAPMDGSVDMITRYWDKECQEIPAYNVPKIKGGILREESRVLFNEYTSRVATGPYHDFAKSLANL